MEVEGGVPGEQLAAEAQEVPAAAAGQVKGMRPEVDGVDVDVGGQEAAAVIVQVSLGDTPQGSTEYRTIFAVGMTLFVMTFAMTLLAHYVVRRFRTAY